MTELQTGPVSVVVVTMNRRAMIEQSLPILLNDSATGEVIVVMDGAEDESLEFLVEWSKRDGRVKPIWQENAGAGAARDRGVASARYDVVVLLDDDVMPTQSLITQHALRHSCGDVDIVLGYMPTTVPSPRRRGQVATVLYSSDYEETCRGYEAQPETIWSHFWSGNFSVRRKQAVTIGIRGQMRLDYHEDLYFGVRCEEVGLRAVFDRSAAGQHAHSRNLRSLSREARRSGEARVILLRWFPHLANDLDPLLVQAGLPRKVIMFLSGEMMRTIMVPALMASSWSFGVLRVWPLETLTTRVMRQVELVYAFRKRMKTYVVPRLI